jgi:hypothetical protein
LKLKAPPTIDQKDMIGVSDDSRKSIFTSKLTKMRRAGTQPFALVRWIQLLCA